jgi:hypothetical protein
VLLRIEVVVHNVKDMRGGRVLDKLPELLKRMRKMDERQGWVTRRKRFYPSLPSPARIPLRSEYPLAE